MPRKVAFTAVYYDTALPENQSQALRVIEQELGEYRDVCITQVVDQHHQTGCASLERVLHV